MARRHLALAEKKAKREHRLLVLWDETGHTFRARLGTTWAQRGVIPVVRRISQRREVTSIVIVTLDGRLYARHIRGAVNGPQIVRALQTFQRQLAQPLLIVWDRLSAHRSAVVRTFLQTHPAQFAMAYLPPYAPDLNPEEQCNAWVKQQMLNALPPSIEALQDLARRTFRRLQQQPHLIRQFFQHAGLSVN